MVKYVAVRAFIFSLALLFLLPYRAGAEVKNEKYALPNGLTVILRSDHSAPVVSLFVMYRVGSRNEQLGTTGISHVLEHMLFRGTAAFPPEKLNALLDSTGAEYNAFTTYDVTGYYETLPPRYLPLAMEIEADRMLHAILSDDALKEERTIVLAELEGAENNPQEILSNEVENLHFSAHPYHWTVGGFKGDVSKLRRDSLISYYRTYYSPKNAVLVIAGDFNGAEGKKLVEKYFGSLPSKAAPPAVTCVEPPQISQKRAIVTKKGKNSYIEVAFHTPSIKDRDYHTMEVTEALLSRGKSSRLYRALVEKGLATKVSSYLWDTKDPGMYDISVTLAPGKTHEEVEAALFAAVESMRVTAPEEKEVVKGRNQVKSSFFRSRESITGIAENLAWFEAVGVPDYLDTYVSKVDAVTSAQVKDAASRYLSTGSCTVGWYRAVEEKKKEAGHSDDSKAETGTECAPLDLRESCNTVTLSAEGPKCLHGRDGKLSAGRYGTGSNNSGMLSASVPVSLKDAKASGAKKTLAFTKFALSNGMRVLLKENHTYPTITINGYVEAGSVNDGAGKEGLAAFTASMLERGNRNRTFQARAEELDSLGASLSYLASRENSPIRGWTLAANLDTVLSMMADDITSPSFPASEIEKVRRETLSQLRRQAEDPESQASLIIREMLFPAGSPYRSNIKGSAESVRALSPEDMAAFHRSNYRPDRTVLVFVGDISKDALREKLEKCFAGWKGDAGKSQAGSVAPQGVIPAAEKGQTRVLTLPETSQVVVAMGGKGLPRSSREYYAMEILNYIVGGNTLTSLLGKAVREKEGLVYYIWSYNVPSRGADGPWFMMYGTSEKNVGRARDIVSSVLRKVADGGVTMAQMEEARKILINRIAVGLEGNASIAGHMEDIEFFGLGEDYYDRLPSLYGSVTREELQALAKKYCSPEKLSTAIAGPYKEK
jgi:zinc protease